MSAEELWDESRDAAMDQILNDLAQHADTGHLEAGMSDNFNVRDSRARGSHIKENGKVLSGLIVVLGLWMMVAPWLLGYGYLTLAFWNSLIVGAIVAAVALARALLPNEFASISWINAALGVWLILSPFVFGFGSDRVTAVGNVNPAVGNHIVAGIFLTALAWLSAIFNNPRLKSERANKDGLH